MRDNPMSAGPPPRLLVVTGGKGGVGVTTIAVNLSVALAEQGLRVVIVDANLHRSDVAALCGLTNQHNIADVLAAKHSIHEVLQRGPAGIQIVPGLTAPRRLQDTSEVALARLQRQLAALGRHADIVILDLGSSEGELVRRFCDAADEVLLVTTTDNVAIMDSYAWIKANLTDRSSSLLRLIVNQATDDRQVEEIACRVAQSCNKFLPTTIDTSHGVLRDEAVMAAATAAVPFVLAAPRGVAARAIQQLAACAAREASMATRQAA